MFRQFDQQINSDAAVMATGNRVTGENRTPQYASVRDFSHLTNYPSGRSRNPMGNRYQQMLPIFTGGQSSGLVGLSASMSASATPIPNRMAARDPEHEVETHNIPASFNPASVSTTITHTSLPLSRGRVNSIYNHHTTRGFAF